MFSKVVDAQPKSRMWYRIGATRNMTGGRKIQPTPKMSGKLKEVSRVYNVECQPCQTRNSSNLITKQYK